MQLHTLYAYDSLQITYNIKNGVRKNK